MASPSPSPSSSSSPRALLPLYSRSSRFTRGLTSNSSRSSAGEDSSCNSTSGIRRWRRISGRTSNRTVMWFFFLPLNNNLRNRSPFAALSLLMLLPVVFPSLFSPLGHASTSILSEWNAPETKHSTLFTEALQRQISDEINSNLWTPLDPQGWEPCIQSSSDPSRGEPSKSNGYIQVFLDGGLNQQRMGICDAVAVAKILNATLLIPHLETNPVWKDASTFSEIFDVDHFVDTLKDDISITRELPPEYTWSTRQYYAVAVRATRVKTAPMHASASWYLQNVLPVLQIHGIAAISPFTHRLSFDKLPKSIQQLRCKVNFKALEFVPHVKALGDVIVRRLRYPVETYEVASDPSNNNAHERIEGRWGSGKFVALHLRFDKDMAAHSGCDFGGGKAERMALTKYRKNIWQGRVLNSQFTDQELRNQGRCPLTPEEVGLLLAALGFDKYTRLYLATYKVYGGVARISTLSKLFPWMDDKKSLASKEELAEVEGKASLLAAVDYYVSMQSDIFISASPGNMHNAVVGHRTYENLKAIRPNMMMLGPLFLNRSIGWDEFQKAVQFGHTNRQGQIKLRKEKQSIYTYPAPDCICHLQQV